MEETPPRKILLVVQYDGTDYSGFQRQPGLPTIQSELEDALSQLLGQETTITGAGRTDAGVHALGQTVTFETGSPIPTERIARALNALLPNEISAVSASVVPNDFHPRYDAKWKLYGYRILNRTLPSPFIGRYAWHLTWDLDIDLMHEAAAVLLGEHDFEAFSSSGSSVESTVRDLRRLDIEPHGEILEIRVEASGFLYMMVRRIVGTLTDVGRGLISVEEVREILRSLDRTRVRTMAPPQGLALIKVTY
ncbi:MAG: tRNA pseudouridine(38-40) synthase TruA [Armatimonadia bacterium]|nr:tRNA pseudouridine(38-40) synthase TruA [Armatimonadia bacterium]